jgi:hypothetical protein
MQATVPGLLLQNLPASVTTELLSAKFSALKPASVSLSSASSASQEQSTMLRFDSEEGIDLDKVRTALKELDVSLSEVVRLPRPALFFRNIEHLKPNSLENRLSSCKDLERVQYVQNSRDKVPHFAVAYFRGGKGEEEALRVLGEMHKSTLDGKRVSVSYK